MDVEMTEFYGTQLIIDERVVSTDPLPKVVEDFFKAYAKALEEVYCGKEMDSKSNQEARCASRGNGCSERKEDSCKEARCCC